MDPTLSHALTALIMSLVAGAGVYGVSHLTAESEIFRPMRTFLIEKSSNTAMVEKIAELHDLPKLVNHIMRLFHFAADLAVCAFCSSWWHAAWIVPLTVAALGGGLGMAFVVYLGSVGVAKVLADMRAKPVKPAATGDRKTLVQMLKDAA